MSQPADATASGATTDAPLTPATGAPAVVATPASPQADTATPAEAPAPSLDDIIAGIPQDVMMRMTDAEADKLLSGDPATVEKFTGIKATAPATAVPAAPAPPAPKADEGPKDEQGKPVKRIYLGHLSHEDQRAVVDLVYAIKDGGAKNVREAIKSLGWTDVPKEVQQAAAATVAAAETTPAAPPDQTPAPAATAGEPEPSDEVAQLRARVATLDADRKEALENYDNAKAQDLVLEIIDAKAQLREAERADAQRQREAATFEEQERDCTMQARDQYAEHMEDAGFMEALRDARDLAELRGDAVMQKPDWPLRLCERVAVKLGKATAPAAAPQRPATPFTESRPKGAVASPAGGQVSMSLEEAERAIDNLSEEEVAATLRLMNAQNARGQRRAA